MSHNDPEMSSELGPVLSRLRSGGMVIVIDDPDREDEADLVMAAEFATADALAFMVRHTTGIICAPMHGRRADDLDLPLMVTANTDPLATAFTVSTDAVGTGTGVSPDARAQTLRLLAFAGAEPDDLQRPGHVFPLRAKAGGVHERPGHTEAAVDLLRVAGLTEVGVISELVGEDGSMMRGAELFTFADDHDLPVISIRRMKELVDRPSEPVDEGGGVTRLGAAELPTMYGRFQATAYRAGDTGLEHLVLIAGDVDAVKESGAGVLVRLHSECMTGDLVGSLRCDCGHQLQQAMRVVASEGAGVIMYLRGHEGRGIGLGRKLQAYSLQEIGLDTIDANTELGLPVDSRDYSVAADILADLGIDRIRLISNNPQKVQAMTEQGVAVIETIQLDSPVTPENRDYLLAKRDRMGHTIALLEWNVPVSG